MGRVRNFWKWFSHTNLLDQLSGKLEKDFFESVYRVTYITGLSTSDRTIGYLLYSNMMKLMIALYNCGQLWYIVTIASSFDVIAQSLSVVLLQSFTMYRYQNLISNKPFYDSLATSMNSPYFDISTERRKKLVEVWAQRNDIYLNVLLLLGNGTLAVWCLYPLFDEIEYNLNTEIRLPFYYKTPILYPVVFLGTLVSLVACAYLVMGTALTMQAHLIHLLCQFSVLADCFENVLHESREGFEGFTEYDLIQNQPFKEKYMHRLSNLVKQHQLLLSHTRILKSIISIPMLGQFVISGIMMCCVGYQAAMTITENAVNCLVAILFLSYNVFELYIICRWSEDITSWSITVGEAIYYSSWECGMTKLCGVRSTIILVLTRANRPVVFSAGGMYNVSIASFGSLVKGSYTALTVLLRLRHN